MILVQILTQLRCCDELLLDWTQHGAGCHVFRAVPRLRLLQVLRNVTRLWGAVPQQLILKVEGLEVSLVHFLSLSLNREKIANAIIYHHLCRLRLRRLDLSLLQLLLPQKGSLLGHALFPVTANCDGQVLIFEK